MTWLTFLVVVGLALMPSVSMVAAQTEALRIRSSFVNSPGELTAVVEFPPGATPKSTDFRLLIDDRCGIGSCGVPRPSMSWGRGPRGGDRCRRSFVLPILRLDDRVTQYLLGSSEVDARLAGIARCIDPQVGVEDLILSRMEKEGLSRLAVKAKHETTIF